VGTLGCSDGKQALQRLLSCSDDDATDTTNNIKVIGVGVTEAGLSSASNQCMRDLTWILYLLYKQRCGNPGKCSHPTGKICIINTDNVPNNGDVIQSHVRVNAQSLGDADSPSSFDSNMSFIEFIDTQVSFLNSMVDRITSARNESNGMIPSCEPLPEKALVICDPGNDLPSWMRDGVVQKRFGVSLYVVTSCFYLVCNAYFSSAFSFAH
jgi:mannitol-1-phosphate/altronate dehydrogenase